MKKLFISALLAAALLFACSNEKTEMTEEAHDHGQMEMAAGETTGHGEENKNYDLGDGCYGHVKIDDKEALSVDDFFLSVNAINGQLGKMENNAMTVNDMKVQGKITSVCKHSGCWVTVEDSEGRELLVTFKDHFSIPKENAIGKDIVFHGSLKTEKTESGDDDISFIADGVMLK